MEAVIWTGVVQSVVFIVGAARRASSCSLAGLPERAARARSSSPSAHDKFSLGSFGLGLATVDVLGRARSTACSSTCRTSASTRATCSATSTARSDAEARRSVWIGALLYLPISAAFLLHRHRAVRVLHARPELLPAGAAAGRTRCFRTSSRTQLPAGLAGLVIAAIFAAAQSTISSSINCSATLLTCDVYQRYLRPSASERERLRVLRVATLLVGAAGTGVALAMMRIKSALDAWWQLAGIFSGGMLGLFLLGFLSRRATSAHAAAGVVAGVVVILWMTLSPAWPDSMAALRSPFHPNLIIVFGTLTILGVGWLFSDRTPGVV